ncbi:MAG: metallophosphoesterase [Puniceicoccaceae bacterium]
METDDHGAPFPERWDPAWIDRRRQMEVKRLGYCGEPDPKHNSSLPWPYRLFKTGLKLSGLYGRGYRNFQQIQLTRIEHGLGDWPDSLDGYQILHISDLHVDLNPALMDPLCRQLENLDADLTVFTGDFWEGSHREFSTALAAMKGILEVIPPSRHGHFGILGNHDPAALGARLEDLGIRILVNESLVIGEDGAAFALAGIDDPYYFKLHDIPAAAAGIPVGLPRILLSHSPQVAPEAEANDFQLMLSGHTHGGQVCLPGGHSLVRMEVVPGPLFRGRWRHGALRGYTTTGAGACHVPVRFNCPAEVVLHTLRSGALSGESASSGH